MKARARESKRERDSERASAASGKRAHVHDDEAGALQHVRVVEALVALEAARARLREPVRFAARRRAAASPAARRPLVELGCAYDLTPTYVYCDAILRD